MRFMSFANEYNLSMYITSSVSSSRTEETRLHNKHMHKSLIYLSLICNNEYRSGNILYE